VSFSKYLDTIAHVRRLTLPPEVEHRNLVRHVVVILTSSRSGSSYFKNLLAQHPAVATLTGEEEPYYLLTFNGFPFTSPSDALQALRKEDMVANYIWQDLTVNDVNENARDTLVNAWYRRFPLQVLREVSKDAIDRAVSIKEETHKPLLLTLLPDEWVGLYDGALPHRSPWQQQFKIEEPPFVQATARTPITVDHLRDHVLLFKTPSDAYRIGLFEQLYPEAKIDYVHLTRGFAQTVNGLMDGWECNFGFFSHNLTLTGLDLTQRLNIEGYSDRYPYGSDWWKFDLPPNWPSFTKNVHLAEVCVNQWESAHTAILESSVKPYRVKCEDLANPASRLAVLNGVFAHMGLTPMDDVQWSGTVMATDNPSRFRWYKRERMMLQLAERKRTQGVMSQLGYSMDPNTWS